MLPLFLGLALAGDCELRDGAYLLTIEPGDGVQTIFGHTALLVYDEAQAGYSPVYDWGRFDVEPLPSLAWKVLNMTKEYYLASTPLEDVVGRYDREQRGILAQRLALSPAEAKQLSQAVAGDLNSGLHFQYNWYAPNCTTMVRDHIDAVLGGAMRAQLMEPGASPAGEVLRHATPHLPLWLGLDWGSGRFARSPVSRFDAAFLPEKLHDELATVKRGGASVVESTCVLGSRTPPRVAEAGPSRFGLLAVLGALWGLAVLGTAGLGRWVAVAGVAGTGLALGSWGTAALLVGSLGTFAPFWGHHNLWLASPLHYALAAAALWHLRSPGSTGPQRVALACVASGGVGLLWAAAGWFADGNAGLWVATQLPLMAAAWGLRPR